MTYAETINEIKSARLDEAPYYVVYDVNNNVIAYGHNWENGVKAELVEMLDENKNYEVTLRDSFYRRYYYEYGKIIVKEI